MNESEIEKFVKDNMAKAEATVRLNQSTPVPRPYRNPPQERMSWQFQVLQNDIHYEQNARDNLVTTRTTILSGDSHSCKKALEELKAIKLHDMKVPMVHSGRYLVCRVIGAPCLMVGVNTLVEDLNGDVEQLALYNFRYNINNLEWISFGTILVIKEPWLRYGSQSKTPSMRVDSPTDVIFIDPADEKLLDKIGAKKWYISMSKDAEKWKNEANEFFKAGKYDKALFLYERAIRCNPENPILYLNKSMTCLKMDSFYNAYESAKIGLEKCGDREKAIYRMGLAAYGMREWKKAADHFLEVVKGFPANEFAPEQLKRAISRISEERNGKYDFKKMFIESKKEKAELDVADYKGPIEISNIPGKGRGIIASKDIKEGTLLAVSKAFARGYSQDFPGILFAINMIRKEADTAAHMLQVIHAMEQLQKNPKRAKELYDLYSGDTVKDEEIPFGIIDAARMYRIGALNRFSNDYMTLNEDQLEKTDDAHLFILPSYFNHSCIANAYRTFYGDVMVIYAGADIKKGEEIYLSYVPPLTEYSKRKETLNSWKFECHCQLCETDSKDKLCFKRDRIFAEFFKYLKANKNSPKKVVAKGEPILKKIRETYSDRNEYKIRLAEMLMFLSQMYADTDNPLKSIQYFEEVLTLVDNPLKYSVNIAFGYIIIAQCYSRIGNNQKYNEMIQKAYKLSFCNNEDHFKMRFSRFL